jgi:hypothetical protein
LDGFLERLIRYVNVTSSKFQACAEVKGVTRDTIADIEVVDPARTEIQMTLA